MRHDDCLPNFFLSNFPLNVRKKFQVLKATVNTDKAREIAKYTHVCGKVTAIFSKLPAVHINAALIWLLKAAYNLDITLCRV